MFCDELACYCREDGVGGRVAQTGAEAEGFGGMGGYEGWIDCVAR